jgi:gas vesicle protein
MLVTPQSGKELRGKIREAIDEARDTMRHSCECNHTAE